MSSPRSEISWKTTYIARGGLVRSWNDVQGAGRLRAELVGVKDRAAMLLPTRLVGQRQWLLRDAADHALQRHGGNRTGRQNRSEDDKLKSCGFER